MASQRLSQVGALLLPPDSSRSGRCANGVDGRPLDAPRGPARDPPLQVDAATRARRTRPIATTSARLDRQRERRRRPLGQMAARAGDVPARRRPPRPSPRPATASRRASWAASTTGSVGADRRGRPPAGTSNEMPSTTARPPYPDREVTATIAGWAGLMDPQECDRAGVTPARARARPRRRRLMMCRMPLHAPGGTPTAPRWVNRRAPGPLRR